MDMGRVGALEQMPVELLRVRDRFGRAMHVARDAVDVELPCVLRPAMLHLQACRVRLIVKTRCERAVAERAIDRRRRRTDARLALAQIAFDARDAVVRERADDRLHLRSSAVDDRRALLARDRIEHADRPRRLRLSGELRCAVDRRRRWMANVVVVHVGLVGRSTDAPAQARP